MRDYKTRSGNYDGYGCAEPSIPLSDVIGMSAIIADWRKPENGTRIVRELEGRFNASWEDSRYVRMYEWRRNWEFANGNQYCYWNETLGEFLPLPVPEEMRYTENQLRGTIAQVVNMQVQGDPAYEVAAANGDWSARQSARMGKNLLLHYAVKLNMGRLRVQSCTDSVLFGFGVKRTFWDPSAGGVKATYVEGSGQPQSLEGIGKMCQESRSPWGWFPQVGREGPHIEGMDYCTDTDWVSPSWILRNFGTNIAAEELERQSAMPYQLTQPGDLNFSVTGLGQTANRRAPLGKCLMLTYYQKPAPVEGFERGLEIRICSNHVLDVRPLQTCPNESPYVASLPYTIYASDSRRGTYYPRPPASDWVEPQMRINQTISHEYTIAGIFTMPNLLTTKGDHLPSEVSFGGEKWEIPQGVDDPRWLAAPPVPEWLFQMKAQADHALDRVAMTFGATRGERSSSDPSGYYLDVLREHDAIDQMATVRDHAKSHEQEGYLLLALAKKYEPAERMLDIVGKNGKASFFAFKKDILKPEMLNIYVQATSMLPYLVTSRQRLITEMADRGLFGPPGQIPAQARRQILAFVNMPGLTELDDLDQIDVNLSERNHGQIIDEGFFAIPTLPSAMEDPAAVEAFEATASAMVESGKAFRIDGDWDPNELLPLAIDRKKESDYSSWPQDVRQRFDGYVKGLKELQSAHAQVIAQSQQAAQETAAELQMRLETQKQEAQAEGRSKVKMMEQAAKAAFSTSELELLHAQGRIDLAKLVLQSDMSKSENEAKEKAASGKED